MRFKIILALMVMIGCNSGEDASEVQSDGGGVTGSVEPVSQFLVDFPIPLHEEMTLVSTSDYHSNVKNIPVCSDVEVSAFRDSDVNFPSLIRPPQGGIEIHRHLS